MSTPLALLVAFLLAVLLVKAGSFLLRWYEVTGDPEFDPGAPADAARRLGFGVGPFLREYLATLVTIAVWCVDAPLELWLRRRRRLRPAAPGEVPVILVHGFFMTPWTLWFLRLHLRRRGLGPLHSLDHHPKFGPIDIFAGQLADLVDAVAGAPEAGGPVDIVAHSMGGLIAARYARAHPGRVRRLVALGTPFHGTRLWAMSVGHSLPQMRPGSPFLKETVEAPGFPGTVEVTSIYSRFDQIVLPCTSSHLERDGVSNVELDGLGHNALLLSPRVARLVADRLVAAPEPLPDGAGNADKGAGTARGASAGRRDESDMGDEGIRA